MQETHPSCNSGLSQVLARLKLATRDDLLSMNPRESEQVESLLEDQAAPILDGKCKADCLYWLQNHTKTNNPQYQKLGLPYQSPFPKKGYFIPLFEAFEKWPRLFIPKTRDMMTSLSVIGHATHKAQWFREETIVQTANEEKVKELVTYAWNFWANQDEALKRLHPILSRSSMLIEWENGGKVRGIPKGEDQIRMFHPTRYIQDESAFLPESQQCYDAAHPVCQQIICISSAGPGWFGDQCALP